MFIYPPGPNTAHLDPPGVNFTQLRPNNTQSHHQYNSDVFEGGFPGGYLFCLLTQWGPASELRSTGDSTRGCDDTRFSGVGKKWEHPIIAYGGGCLVTRTPPFSHWNRVGAASVTTHQGIFFIAVFDFILICRQTAQNLGNVTTEKQVKSTKNGKRNCIFAQFPKFTELRPIAPEVSAHRHPENRFPPFLLHY